MKLLSVFRSAAQALDAPRYYTMSGKPYTTGIESITAQPSFLISTLLLASDLIVNNNLGLDIKHNAYALAVAAGGYLVCEALEKLDTKSGEIIFGPAFKNRVIDRKPERIYAKNGALQPLTSLADLGRLQAHLKVGYRDGSKLGQMFTLYVPLAYAAMVVAKTAGSFGADDATRQHVRDWVAKYPNNGTDMLFDAAFMGVLVSFLVSSVKYHMLKRVQSNDYALRPIAPDGADDKNGPPADGLDMA